MDIVGNSLGDSGQRSDDIFQKSFEKHTVCHIKLIVIRIRNVVISEADPHPVNSKGNFKGTGTFSEQSHLRRFV